MAYIIFTYLVALLSIFFINDAIKEHNEKKTKPVGIIKFFSENNYYGEKNSIKLKSEPLILLCIVAPITFPVIMFIGIAYAIFLGLKKVQLFYKKIKTKA